MSENGDSAVSDMLGPAEVSDGVFEDRTAGIGRSAGPPKGKGLIYQKTMVS
jgi:hypothetical protein